MKTKEQKLLDAAKAIAESSETWADLSNALFDPNKGLLAKAYATKAQRAKFSKTTEYRAIKGLVRAAQQRTGLVEGATPARSGRFVVRLPRSLHEALVAEADDEGVSLNQLVVAKLAMRISRQAAGRSLPA